MTYYGSLGYSTDNSLLKNRALTYDKFTLRSNVSLKITDNLTASMNIGGRYDVTDRPWLSFFDIFKGTRINPPTSTIYANGNPNYYNNFSYQANPAAISDKDYSGYGLEKNKNLQTQFSLEYSVPYVKGLKAKASFVYDYNNYTYKGVRKGLRTYTYGEYTGEYTPTDAYLPALIQANNKSRNVWICNYSFLTTELLKIITFQQPMFLKAEKKKLTGPTENGNSIFMPLTNLIMVVQPTS